MEGTSGGIRTQGYGRMTTVARSTSLFSSSKAGGEAVDDSRDNSAGDHDLLKEEWNGAIFRDREDPRPRSARTPEST